MCKFVEDSHGVANLRTCFDGDRGKDLVLVVEPVVDINLALFINFLKKKIHFDSLITNSQQHFPNDQFIKTLVDTTNGKPVAHELNPELLLFSDLSFSCAM